MTDAIISLLGTLGWNLLLAATNPWVIIPAIVLGPSARSISAIVLGSALIGAAVNVILYFHPSMPPEKNALWFQAGTFAFRTVAALMWALLAAFVAKVFKRARLNGSE